jgi:hypothetical protein
VGARWPNIKFGSDDETCADCLNECARLEQHPSPVLYSCVHRDDTQNNSIYLHHFLCFASRGLLR